MIIKKILKPVLRPIRVAMQPHLRKMRRYLEMSRYGLLRVRSSSAGNSHIASIIRDGTAAAIGKIGSTELFALRMCLRGKASVPKETWEHGQKDLYVCSGVHPCSDEIMNVFFQVYSEALQQMDVLGVWYNEGEASVAKRFCRNATFSYYWCLEPYYHKVPWSAELKGKTVLVMHPFIDTITKQYAKRELIWNQCPEVLPEFNLRTIKVPLYDAVVKSPYENWKVCLDDLKKQMDSIDFDVVLIGAGAYSLPLCAHAKSLGKIGIHMGGAAQILFGVIGNRWVDHPIISGFFNEHWCRPSADESPSARTLVEGGCYW